MIQPADTQPDTEPDVQPIAEDAALGLHSLRARASRGTIASVIGQGASQGLRLVSNLILSKLLFPEAFGLMALVNMLMQGLQAISDVGLQPAIIRHARGDDPSFLDTAWTIQVTRGLTMWLVGTAVALPMAWFYAEPSLRAIVPVATFSAVLGGLASTKIVTLTRHLRPERVLMIEVGAQAAGLVTMVIAAEIERSVWALVIGGLVTAAARALLSQVAIAGPRNRFHWDRHAAQELLSFGRWIFVSTLFTFIATRVDVAMLGRLLPVDMLGVYSIGIILATVVREVLAQITRFVLIPALSVSHRAGLDVLATNFLRVRRVALPAALLAILTATLLAPPFFSKLYDPRYHDAIWIAQLSMAGLWFSYLTDISGSALLAIGDSRAWAWSNGVKAVATSAGCAIGFWIGGLPMLMIGSAVAAFGTYLVSALFLRAHGVRTLRGDLPHTLLGVALAGAGVLLPRLAAPGGDIQRVAIYSLALAPILLIPYGIWVARRLLRAL